MEKLGLSSLVLFSSGKRLLNKSRAARPFPTHTVSRHGAFLVKRSRNQVVSRPNNPLVKLQGVSSHAFNILGTLSIAMTGLLFFVVQPPQQQVFASNASQTVLYQEFQETGHFPMTQQVKQQELAQNKIGQYTVQSGDTVNSICLKLETDCEVLKEYSQLEYPYSLRAGQTLFYKMK